MRVGLILFMFCLRFRSVRAETHYFVEGVRPFVTDVTQCRPLDVTEHPMRVDSYINHWH